MTILGSYSSDRVVLNIGGNTVSGFSVDSKITISRNNDLNTFKEGVDGEITLNRQNKKSGILTISLQGTSEWNNILMNWHMLGEENPDFSWVDVSVREPATNTELLTIGALATQPDIGFNTEVDDREWTFFLTSVDTGVLGTINNAISLIPTNK